MLKPIALIFISLFSSAFSYVYAATTPIICPLNIQGYAHNDWMKTNGEAGTFVLAKWYQDKNDANMGHVECVYVRGPGKLIGQFKVTRPQHKNWNKGIEFKSCLSVASPEDCTF